MQFWLAAASYPAVWSGIRRSVPVTANGSMRTRPLRQIKRIAREHEELIVLLDHAKTRMVERNITRIQILRGFARKAAIEWDTINERGWKCRFSQSMAGEKVTVVAKLVQRHDKHCLVVTVGEEENMYLFYRMWPGQRLPAQWLQTHEIRRWQRYQYSGTEQALSSYRRRHR